MQAYEHDDRFRTVSLPESYVANIARVLERCAQHERERASGRVQFPRVVMVGLAEQAQRWAEFLKSASGEPG
jgi:hypothetical protein